MRPLEFSIARLLMFIAVVALGIAALRNASEAWAGSMLLLTLGLLGTAVLGLVYRRERQRAWWLGFTLSGWGYVSLTLAPWSPTEPRPIRALLDELYRGLAPSKVVAMDPFAASAAMDQGRVLDPNPPAESLPSPAFAPDAVVTIGRVDPAAFRTIGHCLITLVAGTIGGLIARWFHTTRRLAGVSETLVRPDDGADDA